MHPASGPRLPVRTFAGIRSSARSRAILAWLAADRVFTWSTPCCCGRSPSTVRHGSCGLQSPLLASRSISRAELPRSAGNPASSTSRIPRSGRGLAVEASARVAAMAGQCVSFRSAENRSAPRTILQPGEDRRRPERRSARDTCGAAFASDPSNPRPDRRLDGEPHRDRVLPPASSPSLRDA